MIANLIAWSLRNRFLVALGTLALVLAGLWAVRTTPVDALPDLSDVQVVIQTEFSEQAPQIVEDQVTYPIASELLKVPGIGPVKLRLYGEEVAAFITLRPGKKLEPEWVREYCRKSLAGFKVPREILFIGELPKGPSGKIQRRRLVDVYHRVTSQQEKEEGI